MRIINCEQYSPEWWAARLGIPTSSQFKRIIKANGDPSASRHAYLCELAAERITGVQEDTYVSRAMEKGSEREELSRQVYEMEYEVEVIRCGIALSDCGRWGASTDGLVGTDGCIELKNPSGGTHVARILKPDKLPSEAQRQVQGEIFAAEREWCDFVSYVPGLRLFVLHVEPEYQFLKRLEAALIEFCDELDEICKRLRGVGAFEITAGVVTAEAITVGDPFDAPLL